MRQNFNIFTGRLEEEDALDNVLKVTLNITTLRGQLTLWTTCSENSKNALYQQLRVVKFHRTSCLHYELQSTDFSHVLCSCLILPAANSIEDDTMCSDSLLLTNHNVPGKNKHINESLWLIFIIHNAYHETTSTSSTRVCRDVWIGSFRHWAWTVNKRNWTCLLSRTSWCLTTYNTKSLSKATISSQLHKVQQRLGSAQDWLTPTHRTRGQVYHLTSEAFM